MNKIIFTIKMDHSIDLITNSSSELFVLNGQSKEILTEAIDTLYHDYIFEKNDQNLINTTYLDSYESLRNITELTADELDTYFRYLTFPHIWPAKKSNYHIPNGFTFDELYSPKDEEPAWNGEIQYELKNNLKEIKNKWDSAFVTDDNKDEIINKLSPNKDMYFLFSIDENPDYDFQEKLETIGTRFHLG